MAIVGLAIAAPMRFGGDVGGISGALATTFGSIPSIRFSGISFGTTASIDARRWHASRKPVRIEPNRWLKERRSLRGRLMAGHRGEAAAKTRRHYTSETGGKMTR